MPPERPIDRLLAEARQLTPREAAVFLLNFDRYFRAMVGCNPNDAQRVIVSTLLRRVARAGA
jgi:hypothetical protein